MWPLEFWGAASPEIVAETQGAMLMPAAVLGTVIGGAVAWALTWRSLRGPRRSEAMRSIGWSAASRRDCLIAGLVDVVLAFVCLFGLVASFPPLASTLPHSLPERAGAGAGPATCGRYLRSSWRRPSKSSCSGACSSPGSRGGGG